MSISILLLLLSPAGADGLPGNPVAASLSPSAGAEARAEAAVRPDDDEPEWIVEASDHICGLSDPRSLSDPAKVDYPHLWDATPEIRKLKDEDIDPDSPQGIALREQATDRIREACDEVREDEGHCSVWKRIRHEDGRKIPDVTDDVEEKFPEELDR